MSSISTLSRVGRLSIGRPIGAWRLQPFGADDGDVHHLVPAVYGSNHIITDALLTIEGQTRVEVMISDTSGLELFPLSNSYELSPLRFGTHCVLVAGRGIDCQRIQGANRYTVVLFGYTEDCEDVQQIYTGV